LVANDSRRYPLRPVLGVGALSFQDDRILLIERGREPLKGQWSLPGGGVETGERLEDAVRREVLEETGIEVAVREVALIFERLIPDEHGQTEYHFVLVDFLCQVTGGTLCAGDDCSQARWFGLDEVDSLPMTEGTVAVIRRVRSSGPSLSVLCP
jgi:8-oxo-dGTP diphosphatase